MKLGILSFGLLVGLAIWGQSTPQISHEFEKFYSEVGERFGKLENGLSEGDPRKSITDKFLKTVLTQLLKKEQSSKEFIELAVSPSLETKVKNLLKELKNKKDESAKDKNKNDGEDLKKKDSGASAEGRITFDSLKEILEKFSKKFSDEERTEMAALILAHVEKQVSKDEKVKTSTEAAIESLIKKYDADPILKELPESKKKGLARLTELLSSALSNPESLDSTFAPIKEQIFESALSELAPLQKSRAPSFNQFMSDLKNLNSLKDESPNVPNGLALNPLKGGGATRAGSCNSHGRFGVPAGEGVAGSFSPAPETNDSAELAACLRHVRGDSEKKIPGLRFNVELQLPGALCASTPIAKNPKELSKSFQKKQTTPGLCSVNLASARHCFEGIGNVTGSLIAAKIGERNVGVTVSQVGSADQSFGPSVQNGNPDLVVMTVEMPCSQAAQLDIARVPSPEEIKVLFQNDSIPLVLQQNSAINASEDGGNRATIAATGNVDGNFIRFNSKSRFNETSGQDVGPLSSSAGLVFDSNRIKSGDSGGAGLTCKLKDGKVEEVLFLGAISHIDVRKDRDEGKLGGVASGQSLLNLSRRFWGDERSLASRAGKNGNSNNPDHGS